MATTLYGDVYYKDKYAGILQQEPGNRYLFTYDTEYLNNQNPPIAYTLPLQKEAHISEYALHPFFDNLVAEGWLNKYQARALGVNPANRFALLLGFGFDLAGAVSIKDRDPLKHKEIDSENANVHAALLGRASLSGVQPKVLVIKEGKRYRPVRPNELSTHIAKLPSGNLSEIIELEFLTLKVAQILLPSDEIVDPEIDSVETLSEKALIIPRFDRTPTGNRKHFEEFNQLFGKSAGDDKYDGSYEQMGDFIRNTPDCIPVEIDRLFRRILVCLLLGNTDAHLKNFAMFHTKEGLRLTPAYDLVAAAVYPEYHTIALRIDGAQNLSIGKLQPKHIVNMAKNFQLNEKILLNTIAELQNKLSKAKEFIEKSSIGSSFLHNKLLDLMEKRWNGTFALIGPLLSKRQSKEEKRKS
jgi:serine/threonine-protein kinase HipA